MPRRSNFIILSLADEPGLDHVRARSVVQARIVAQMLDNGVPIRSVSRSLSVLRTINHHGCISLMDISRFEELPYPTTFRIVQTLMHEGLIERDGPGKRYRPTALVQSLASGYSDTMLRTHAQPHLSALTRECGWPALLSIRVGARMVIQASSHRETTLTISNWEPGISIPLDNSATGYAWLAHLPASHVRDLVRWGIGDELGADMGGDGAGSAGDERFLDKLAAIRMQGYAWRPSTYDDHIKTASLAAPVYQDGALACVLTLTYFASAMKEQEAIARLLPPLRRAASAISGQLTPIAA
jgi:IclR family mhp operon transcriptional activator